MAAFCIFSSPSQVDKYFFGEIGKYLDNYSQTYSKFLLIGDFNVEESEPVLEQFLHGYNALNIVHENTCYKSMKNTSCIDLIITSSPNSFQRTPIFCKQLSDFHKLVVTTLKAHSNVRYSFWQLKSL